MSQSLLVLFFALVFGMLGAALIARDTSVKTQERRTVRVCAYSATLVSIAYMIVALHLRFNFTPSVPLGIYRLMPLPKSAIRRGMLVAACAPLVVAELGRRRRYLVSGPCPDDTELLLKTIAAVAGDKVTISIQGVTVNGCLLQNSQPLSQDADGRRLSPWPRGHYQLRASQLWLYADNRRSWDSRYWGPAAAATATAQAIPVLVASGALDPTNCEFGHARRHQLALITLKPPTLFPRSFKKGIIIAY